MNIRNVSFTLAFIFHFGFVCSVIFFNSSPIAAWISSRLFVLAFTSCVVAFMHQAAGTFWRYMLPIVLIVMFVVVAPNIILEIYLSF